MAERKNKDYAGLQEELLDRLLQDRTFSYNINTDAVYNYYKDLYRKQGTEAADNVYATAAARTGGYANSYASALADSTYAEYMQQLRQLAYDRYDTAYSRYQDERQDDYDLYGLVHAREKEAYDRKQDDIAFAFKAAQNGDNSYLKNIGVTSAEADTSATDTADAKEKINSDIINTAENIYFVWGQTSLEVYLDRQVAYGNLGEKGKQQILSALKDAKQYSAYRWG